MTPSPPDPPAPAPSSGLALRAAIWSALGLCVVVVLVRLGGLTETLEVVGEARWALVALATVVLSLQIPLMGLRWWVALRFLGYRVPLVVMIRTNTANNLLNFVAPGHVGEVVTSFWLARTTSVEGVAAFTALVTCKVLGALVNMVLGAVLVASIGGALLGGGTGILAGAGTGALVILGLVVVAREDTGGGIGRLITAVASWSPRVLSPLLGVERAETIGGRVIDWVSHTWARGREALRRLVGDPRALAVIGLITALKVVLSALSFHLLFRSVGDASTVSWAGQVLVSIGNDLAYVVGLQVPFNLGAQEAVIYGGLDALGQPPATALAVAVLFRVVTVAEKAISGLVVLVLAPFGRS